MSTRLQGLVLVLVLTAGAPGQVCGDCNSDGVANIVDALLGAQHAAALVTLVGQDFDGCDVDSSTSVSPLMNRVITL